MLCFFRCKYTGGEMISRGVDCSDLHTARRQALLYAAQTEDPAATRAWYGGEIRIEIRDEHGDLLTTVVIVAVDTESTGRATDKLSDADLKAKTDFILGPGHAWRKRNDRNT